jgi:hypothetical protein
LFRGLITVKTQTGSANTASVTWSPVTEAEDGSISDMAS